MPCPQDGASGHLRATSGPAEGGSRFCGGPLPPPGGRTPVYVVVEDVRSLFNVGAIFRSADGIQAAGVYLAGFTGRPPRKEIARVALGAEDAVPWRYVPSARDAVAALSSAGVTVYALEQAPGSADFRNVAYRFPAAFVVGHEVEGVRPETLAACAAAVHIPMRGAKRSLNVSVAAGIMLYHLMTRALDGARGAPQGGPLRWLKTRRSAPSKRRWRL